MADWTQDETKQDTQADDFFSPLGQDRPYLKIAAEGFAGSGKTYTLAHIAIGLHKKIASVKPVVFFDTEESAGHLTDDFAAAGIEAVVRRSRSLADLKETMARCRAGFSDILIIDSITHVWEDFLAAYQSTKKRTKLEFQDWGVIKPTWKREFSEPFVRDRYHALMTGRAGFAYDDEIDENGKRQIFKSGVKMKAETETAYEPDVLLLMERKEDIVGKERKVWREAMVLKDRGQKIDGTVIINPTFADFETTLDKMLRTAVEMKQPLERSAGDLFEAEDKKKEFLKRRDIALETIEAWLTTELPGQTAEAKRAKALALKDTLGTPSWTAIKGMHPDKLEAAVVALGTWLETRKHAASNGAAEEAVS
jgi:hypothetical protein